MIIPIWVIIVAILIAAFPIYWKILDGKHIREYNDYIPVLNEVVGYLCSVLITICCAVILYCITSLIVFCGKEIWNTDWLGMLNHEAIYIK